MNPEVLAALENGNQVVTSTRRLRYELSSAFDRVQLSRGNSVWHTPLINTWDGWIQDLWNKQNAYSQKILLSAPQLQQLLCQIIERDLETHPPQGDENLPALWNIPATAKTALETWQLCYQWQIPYSRLKQAAIEDHARFGRWASTLYAQLQQQSWTSQFQLPELLTQEQVIPDEAILLAGFDQFTPQQQAFLDLLRHGGANIAVLEDAPAPETRLQRYSFDTPYDEWRCIGAWARQRLEQHDQARIAIVTPDIESIQSQARMALREQLSPGYFMDNSEDPFHFSLGERLAETPVIHSALAVLSLFNTLEYPQFEAIFLSAYWGEKDEQPLRGELVLELRRKIAFQFNLLELLNVLKPILSHRSTAAGPGVRLLERLESLNALNRDSQKPRPLSDWRETFTQALNMLGWPGDQQNSIEFQTIQAWERCLEDWVRLDLVGRPQGPRQALSSLERHCHETQFQAQAHNEAPIQIMGVLETAGLDFDEVWLAGFDEAAWPPSASINPFIPVATQIDCGIPQTIPSKQHAFNVEKTRQLCQMSSSVRISHARVHNEIKRNISLLVPELPLSETSDLPDVWMRDDYLRASTPVLESYEDEYGLPYTEPKAQGGTGLIQKQSVCPFSAYARYRLKLSEDDRPHMGMDNMQRGSLLHQIMEQIWNELQDSNTLHDYADRGELPDLIMRHAQQQVAVFSRNSGMGEAYRNAELERLTSLVEEWLQLELERSPFRVTATEQSIDYPVADLQLNIKIDRIDELGPTTGQAHTSLLVMDYKSGRCSLKDWANERPAQPQVPLYYLAMDGILNQSTDALAFAQIRQQDSVFVGVSRSEGMLPGIHSLESLPGNSALKRAYPHWEDLASGWRTRIEQLAGEFRQGYAVVDPRHNACDWCQLFPLCRIHSSRKEAFHDTD